MKKRVLLVTGASGLIGSEVVVNLAHKFDAVYGVDNNMRKAFFGPQGDTRWRQRVLAETVKTYRHVELDIRDRQGVIDLLAETRPALIVHAAAQPSHDLAARLPFEDFDVNAVGTMNLLEAARGKAPEAVFAHLSTNKVYGDKPNQVPLVELKTRWDYADPAYRNGIPETFDIDQSTHSLFGASKVAADIMVQEYGRYFATMTCCLRGGCLTGPNHAGVELHGFLSYLIKCNLEGKNYTIFGYKGKQVRDNIHACDVASFIEEFYEDPRPGEVYNVGGGRENSISILESFEKIQQISGKEMFYDYVEDNRQGDHICYISDLSKMKAHYPNWRLTRSLDDIFLEIYEGWRDRNIAR